MSTRRLGLIGNGMAGFRLVRELRRLDPSWAITVFEQEPHPPYDRLLLSGALAGTAGPGELTLKPLEWYAAEGVELLGGRRVTRLDPSAGQIEDDRGERRRFDACVIATGSEPVVPPIPGAGLEGVSTFRTLDDASGLARRARPGGRAVVIGGGLLGVEVARALQLRGMGVTIVHLVERLMEKQLDGEGAAVVRAELERLGVRVLLGGGARALLGERRVEAVLTASGEVLPAEVVVVCAGVRPSVSLAAAAGIRTGRGVLVDDHLRTSSPGVFAIGECAEHRGRTPGLVDVAHEHADVLARRLAGDREAALAPAVEAATLKVAGLQAFAAGAVDARAGDLAESVRDEARGVYKRLLFRADVLAGAILVGDIRSRAHVLSALRGRAPVADGRALLGLGDAPGAAHLPDEALICGCRGVSKAAILAALGAGGRSLACVARRTGASRSCGGCAGDIGELIEAVGAAR